MMYNKTTKQHGKWVTVEDVEFLKVDSGNFIPKDNVGEDWVEFNDQTTQMLLELADAVEREEDVSFLLIKHKGDGAEMLGHEISDKMMLLFIMAMVENFVDGDPIKLVMVMMAIKETLEDDE